MLNVEICNLDTTWVEVESVCVPSLRAPSHVTKISEAENGQKVVNFKVVYLQISNLPKIFLGMKL